MALWVRLRGAMGATWKGHDFDDELASHIEMHTEDGVRAGLSREEARRQAMIRLGGAEQVRQMVRERRGLPGLDSLARDVRYGWRMILRNPGFSAVAVLTLAFGIGANTAIFSLIDSLFLKPLAVPHPERLVRIYARGPSGHYGAGFSMPEFRHLREDLSSLSAMSSEDHVPQLNLVTEGSSASIGGAFVSAGYFDVVGVRPQLGRWFLPEEDSVPGRNPVVVLSDRLWKVRFRADAGVLGREVKINNVALTIVGVAPEGFFGAQTGLPEDVWIPSMMLGKAGYGCPDGTFNCSLLDSIVGRLTENTSPVAAMAETQSKIAWLASDWPEIPSRRQVAIFPASSRTPDEGADDLAQMRLLMAVTVALLLIACANLAGLLLARGESRRREIAVRLALGARRGRVIRQLLTENLMLALAGGVLGTCFAIGMERVLSRFYETDSEGFHHLYDLSFDWRVLAYSLGVTLMLGALFGLVPALRAPRSEITHELKTAVGSAQPMKSRMGGWLVAGQIALSMVLVVSAALLVRSGLDLERGTNFDPAHVAVFRLRPELLKYTPQQVGTLAAEMDRRLSAMPGVESVAFMQGGEGLVWNWQNGRDAQVARPGDAPAKSHVGPHAGLTVAKQDVSANFFHTLRIPLLAGREFGSQDRADTPRAAIVNKALAQRLWSRGTAVGQKLLVGGEPYEVVGVAADIQPWNAVHAPEPHLYLSYWQSNSIREGDIRVAVRVGGDPAAAIEEMRRAIAAFDPAVPFGEDMAMSEQVRLEYSPVMLARTVSMYCGVLALCLSAIGLYSILAFTVRTRTHEIGVRMALGARREDVMRMVVAQGARLAAIGVGMGVAASMLLTRVEARLLFGVNANDPLSYAVVAAILVAVAVAACLLPARRAASIDPIQALRTE